MFDVIIIDEASQCGPDALPLFYLGKKILIVGDDQQISPEHVGVNRDDAVQRREELLNDFQFKDAFDIDSSLFSQGERRLGNRIVLREHFRCMPEIIRFSNDLCYKSSPLIPLRQYPPNRLEPLVRRHVEDGYREGSSQSAINKPEAAAISRAIMDCCQDTTRYTAGGKKMTMGVIALQGKAQAHMIENLLLEEIGAEEMSDRQIICGDAYSFQGDERDVMFLSMVAAPNTRIGSLTRGADMRRFNVAASRARDQLWLFHSVTLNDLSPTCMRRLLLQHFISPDRQVGGNLDIGLDELRNQARTVNRNVIDPPEQFDSWFEVDIALEIMNRGYQIIPQLEIAGYRIDLVVRGWQAELSVECDGDVWHGPDRYDADLARQRKLERAGRQFWRIRGSAYYANRQESMNSLWSRLDEMGIRPVGSEPEELQQFEEQHVETGLEEQDSSTNKRLDPVPFQLKGEDTRGRSGRLFESVTSSPEDTEPDTNIQPTSDCPEEFSTIIENVNTKPNDRMQQIEELETYTHWDIKRLPDPRKSAQGLVIRGLEQIVKEEGPMLCLRAYQLYAKSLGISRVGTELKRCFNTAMYKAIKSGLVVGIDELETGGQIYQIVRSKNCPTVRPRTRGDRQIAEIPPSELAWMMLHIKSDYAHLDDEELFRKTLAAYGIMRVRSSTKVRLKKIMIKFNLQ